MKPFLSLKTLTLRNFATFENQEITFHPKFNGIIGETGSGKSLILDAFELLLGARADKKLVRKNASFACIEGVFDIKGESFKQFFDDMGFPISQEDNGSSQVVIKRLIYATGKSKSYLNHFNSPLHILNKFSKNFVDLVGQFENQKLTRSDYQLHLLDQYAQTNKLLDKYSDHYGQYNEILKEIDTLQMTLSQKLQQEDYIHFQMRELSKLSPSKEDEENLISIKDQILNSEEIQKNLELLKEVFSEGEVNLIGLSTQCLDLIEKCDSLFSSSEIAEFESLKSKLEDFSYAISKANIESDENNSLEDVLTKLDQYQKLKRKFNVKTEDLTDLLTKFEEEISQLRNMEEKLNQLTLERESREKELYQLAMELHEERKKEAFVLSQQITKGLHELNMPGATFSIKVEKLQKLSPSGISQIIFMAETNKGEGQFKIKEIASGGELSRILLCIRQIVASEDSISIFFFDEIDTGIGGETATKIAKALKKVSQKGQILAITHLAQIAREVDEIIYVDKKSLSQEKGTRTISFVSNKRGKERENVVKSLAGL